MNDETSIGSIAVASWVILQRLVDYLLRKGVLTQRDLAFIIEDALRTAAEFDDIQDREEAQALAAVTQLLGTMHPGILGNFPGDRQV